MPADAELKQPPRAIELVVLVEALLISWLLMLAVHELGHVLHAWFSGGQVTHVVLAPLSRTEVSPNPRPQFVAWGGPIWGCMLPILFWLSVRQLVRRYDVALKCFAGFCLIANGAYLLGGSLLRDGDAADLMQHGAPRWLLVFVGSVGLIAGMYAWHTLGPRFGLALQSDRALRRAAAVLAVILVCTVIAECIHAARLAD